MLIASLWAPLLSEKILSGARDGAMFVGEISGVKNLGRDVAPEQE